MKRDYAHLARLQPTLRLCCFHLRSNHMGSTEKKRLFKEIYRRSNGSQATCPEPGWCVKTKAKRL